MISLRQSMLNTKDTKHVLSKVEGSTKFRTLVVRTFRVLHNLRGDNSISFGCALAVFGALLLPAIGNAQPLCVRVLNDNGIEHSVPVRLGSTLRLSFRHSIYGSQVEELFALRRDGFQLTQLRYTEARLVEFYGYENAKHENAVWVVSSTPTIFPSLNISLSDDASMSLHFDHLGDSKPFMIQPGSALRLSVASCKSRANG